MLKNKSMVFWSGIAGLVIALTMLTVFSVVPPVKMASAAPTGIDKLKFFNDLSSAEVESTVNTWLSGRTNVSIDSIDVSGGGGANFLIAIGYRTRTGATTTRIKLVEYQGELRGDAGTQAAQQLVNSFLTSLPGSNNVRAVDVLPGEGGLPAAFIIYD